MRKAIALLALLAVGCGQPSETAQDSPASCDFVGATGMCVAFDPDVTNRTDPAHYEAMFTDTVQCAYSNGWIDSTNISGPVVRVVAYRPNGYLGWYENRQITLNEMAERSTFAHEVVHYLVGLNHAHPAFATCAPVMGDGGIVAPID